MYGTPLTFLSCFVCLILRTTLPKGIHKKLTSSTKYQSLNSHSDFPNGVTILYRVYLLAYFIVLTFLVDPVP